MGKKIITAVLALGILLWFFIALGKLNAGQENEGKEQLQEALRRSAVACYASQGQYPPNLEYLCRHYGVQIDESRYHVFYEVFAENLMPQITVTERAYEE